MKGKGETRISAFDNEPTINWYQIFSFYHKQFKDWKTYMKQLFQTWDYKQHKTVIDKRKNILGEC